MLQNKNAENSDTFEYFDKLEIVLQKLVLIDRAKNDEELNYSLNKLLEAIGRYTDSERVYIFEASENGNIFTNTYEWCAEGVEPQIKYLQQIRVGDMPYWYQSFLNGDIIIIDNIEDVKESTPNEYEILKAQDIKSEISFPIYHSSKLLGFFGLDNPKTNKSHKFTNLLEVVGGHIGSTWVSCHADRDIKINRDILQEKKQELERERLFLEILCQEYTAVYYVNLLTGTFNIVKLSILSNTSKFMETSGRTGSDYMSMLNMYADKCILNKKTSDDFKKQLDISNLRKTLSRKANISFRYQSLVNEAGHEYFEVKAIRVCNNKDEFGVMIGFRYIDDIIAQERHHQAELERAFSEVKMSNEIISAIGKIYSSVFYIDLERDYFEEVSSDNEIHRLTGKRGIASSKMKELCDNFVADEYHDNVMDFFDLTTVAERLKTDDTTAVEYLAKDGNWHLARFIAKKRNSEGRVIDILYVANLISDTKHREQNLILIAEEANRANEAKTEFLSRIAHDIRTPMNAISGFTSIAKANINNTEKVEKSLLQVETAGKYLQQIVDDVLDLTRIEKGQMKPNLEETSITGLFKEHELTMKDLGNDKSLNITYKIHDILHDRLMIDSLHLKQIYTNLISNAIKYTPKGGAIEFEIYEEEIPDSKKVRLVSFVRDTGIGMTKEYMKEMYNRFSRAVDTRVNAVRGSGLGLAVVKEFVTLLGGKIEAKSKIEKGTEFKVTFEFEYVDNKKSVSYKSDNTDYNLCAGIKILAAEDNDLNFEVLKELLEMYKVSCDRAENGAVCVEKIKNSEKKYDIILMDMQMPIMDGIEAAKAIRSIKTEYAQNIPIIALTANAFNTDRQACLEAGMNEHLSKPFDIKKLISMLISYKK